jgi:hypothetical protein
MELFLVRNLDYSLPFNGAVSCKKPLTTASPSMELFLVGNLDYSLHPSTKLFLVGNL